MKLVRLYSDAHGVSHFEDLDMPLETVQYAPPSPAIDVSDPIPASRAVLFAVPAGYFGDWHPTPRRQLYFQLQGQLELGSSDGETRVFGPGDIVLVEDDVAPGHTTRVVGQGSASGAFVHLLETAG